MHGLEFLIPIFFFVSAAATIVGVAMARVWGRKIDKQPHIPPEIADRLERMEQAIDSIAIEVERISEGQRFTTKLLAERGSSGSLPPASPAREG